MKIIKSNATFSSIVGIGEKVKRAALDSGEQYLELNRGVNAVQNIDLTNRLLNHIDTNSKEFQTYAPNKGLVSLRRAIIEEYFPSKVDKVDNISITPGGMPALDLILQILDVETFHFPTFYWGSYSKMANIRKRNYNFYDSLAELSTRTSSLDCVFICDPNNPTGIKMDDDLLYKAIEDITNTGATVIFDCPYRKLFYDNNFFDKVTNLKNVIVTESFSKWIGLSGVRLGFIWSDNQEFNEELNIRLLYEFNGVASPSQLIVQYLLTTLPGKIAIKDFRNITVENIAKNIQYLSDRGLLADEIYNGVKPIGLFAIINKSEDLLFQNKIGAVGLDKFTNTNKEKWSKFSRISCSVKHDIFKKFISKIN
jgi:aspartate/methionine/tyrosine aminotransferase